MPKLLSSIKRFIGKSTEGKATDSPNGSTFLETDTGNTFIFSTVDGWHLKNEADITLRLEIIKSNDALLEELKKVNENLMLVIDAFDG